MNKVNWKKKSLVVIQLYPLGYMQVKSKDTIKVREGIRKVPKSPQVIFSRNLKQSSAAWSDWFDIESYSKAK